MLLRRRQTEAERGTLGSPSLDGAANISAYFVRVRIPSYRCRSIESRSYTPGKLIRGRPSPVARLSTSEAERDQPKKLVE